MIKLSILLKKEQKILNMKFYQKKFFLEYLKRKKNPKTILITYYYLIIQVKILRKIQ